MRRLWFFIGTAAGLTVGVLIGFFMGIVTLYNALYKIWESEEQCGTKDGNARRLYHDFPDGARGRGKMQHICDIFKISQKSNEFLMNAGERLDNTERC